MHFFYYLYKNLIPTTLLHSKVYTYYEPAKELFKNHTLAAAVKFDNQNITVVFGDKISIGDNPEQYVMGGCLRQGNRSFFVLITDNSQIKLEELKLPITINKNTLLDLEKYNILVAEWAKNLVYQTNFLCIIIIII
jgi:hypothetical protein